MTDKRGVGVCPVKDGLDGLGKVGVAVEMQFNYPVLIRQQAGDACQVSLPDFPEVGSVSSTLEGALSIADDALASAISNRIRRNQPVPLPSTVRGKAPLHRAALPALLSAKVALYLAMRHAGLSKVALARRLNHDEKEVRRLLDPSHPSKLPRIEAALAVLGMRLVIGLHQG
ncbi:MAG: type II toxin-antitoxin system HicB family antitoxin [Magnetococcus sp. MYC-9]